MSTPHLNALENALARRGWQAVAVHPGDDYRISATWELIRGDASLLIDFDGMGPEGDYCLQLAESYGCHLRGHPLQGLYFRRVNRSRELWEKELAEFVQSLDDMAAGKPDNEPDRDELYRHRLWSRANELGGSP
jgi:hypothetical protein